MGGGRENALANVIMNIASYPKKPFGLKLDEKAFFGLLPELSPEACKSYDKDGGRFFALVQTTLGRDWEKDADELFDKGEKFKDLCVEIGGYNVPFDELTPVTPHSEEAIDFGSRLAIFANLRSLFLHQAMFLSVTIILAKAHEKNLIGIKASDAVKMVEYQP